MSGKLTQWGKERAAWAGVGNARTAAAGMYLALATALPGTPETATLAQYAGHELTQGGYSRQSVTWNSPAGTPPVVDNSGTVTWGPITDDPPEVDSVFLTDTSTGTGGTVLAYWTVTNPRDAAADDSLRFLPGELDMTVD